MKKLNNRGFAISTMLYGILAIVIIVLMLLLNIMKTSYNKENAATDEIYYYLNKCVSKQIALEKCYKTYNDDLNNIKTCNDEYYDYTKCMDSNINTNIDKEFLDDILLKNINENSPSITSDPTSENRYVFIGNNPNNYIKIGNKLGRILALEQDGTTKIILDSGINEGYISNANIESNSIAYWEKSNIYESFNQIYYSLEIKDKKTLAIYNFHNILENDTLNALTKPSELKKEDYYGLISLSDYLKASSNIIEGGTNYCNLNDTSSNSLNQALTNCKQNNWLNKETCSWTNTSKNNNEHYFTFNTNEIIENSITSSCNFQIVFFLNNKAIITTGNGTYESPYILE